MRGDVVYRVYGVHEGRAEDQVFGAFRSQAEADDEVVKLAAREMHGENWASRYHDQGFVVRAHVVDTDFEIPTRPKPRDRYAIKTSDKPNGAGISSSTTVEVLLRHGARVEPMCTYERNHAMFQTFEPFRQGTRALALVSRDYQKTAVIDVVSGEIIAEEELTGRGEFCPAGFYVPDWWDIHDGSVIPGSARWSSDDEWPTGDFGFVWGCVWGDDSSWKVQYLDLRRVQEGIILRDERFGYVELATGRYVTPCMRPPPEHGSASLPPDFIRVDRHAGVTRARFCVELDFQLDTGLIDPDQDSDLARPSKRGGA
jgi:hypothetical protein